MAAMDVPVEKYYNDRADKKISDEWWGQKKERVHESVFPLVRRLREEQSQRYDQHLRFARLYVNKDIISLRGGRFSKIQETKAVSSDRVTYNVVKSCIDSASAKISKEKPRPLFLTENGSWKIQQKAKRASQFIQGVFAGMGTGWGTNRSLYGVGRQAFRDGASFGTGPTHFFVPQDTSVIKAERIFVNEIVVDEMEAMYGQPRQIHRFTQINRDVLRCLYPKYASEISQVEASEEEMKLSFVQSSLVDVIESWHLPSGPGEKDGKHVITISNCTLFYEDYTDDYLPFLFQKWCEPILGFYGLSLTEELIGIQLEISKILRVIRIAQHLMSVPQVWLEYQNKIVGKQIDNEIGGMKYYTGKPPVFATPAAMNAEMYEHLERLYKKAYELTGISQLSAQGIKPAGLDAAVAIRAMQDIENERFAIQQLMYEEYFMDATTLIMRQCRKLKEKGKDPVVQFRDGNSMKTIRFSDIDMPDDQFVVKAYPTNFLPSTPSGKLQDVIELTKGGFYTQEESLELLDFPDLKKVNNLKTAGRDDVLKVLEKMIDTETYISPEPYMNLDLAKVLSQSYYLRCKCDQAPESVLDLLRTFMADVKREIDKRDASILPKVPNQNNVVTAVPEPAPKSDLLPNAPIPPQPIAA